MKITTESGAVYTFDGEFVTRVGNDAELRRDGERLRHRLNDKPEVGRRLILFLEPLALNADVTIRTTTPVVTIEA